MAELHVPVKWTHGLPRSKRATITKAGCFVLEHDATGRFWVFESPKVSEEVDKQLALLGQGKHPCKLFNTLYEKDSLIRVFEYPSKSAESRAKLLQALKDDRGDYLCLNEVPKRARRKSSKPT